MTFQGMVFLDAIGLLLLLWVLNLVRRDRLYVGYGVIFVLAIAGAMLLVSIPPVLTVAARIVGAIFPTSALTLLALCFMIFLLVYILTQVTLVSNRLARLVQEIAIQRAQEIARSGSAHAGGSAASRP